MKTLGYIALVAASMMLVSSCGEKSPFVKRSVFEQSKNENTELRNDLQNLQNSFAKQNEDLASILSDLATISRRTSQIRLNVENNIAESDTLVLIYENIDAIKLRIDKLEQEANRARQLNKSLAVATRTIKELRETVSAQESKIAELTEELKSKDSTIKMQKSTIAVQSQKISSQTETIVSQEAAIKKTTADQIEMIYQAGCALEDIADNGDFKVTGRRDRNSVKEYRKSIYGKAATYYETAIAQGHELAQKKLENLNKKIAELR